jgi:uncharacterized Zn finger protein
MFLQSHWERIKRDYDLELRAISETEYCVPCGTYMNKYRTKPNSKLENRGVFYHCPECGHVIQAMRPLHMPVQRKNWALLNEEEETEEEEAEEDTENGSRDTADDEGFKEEVMTPTLKLEDTDEKADADEEIDDEAIEVGG